MTRISTEPPRVVVGVDDSPAARWALARAVGEARRRGLPLLIVHAIRPPRAGHLTTHLPMPLDVTPMQRDCAIAIRALLAEMAIPPEVAFTITCPYGHPGKVLTRLAREGDLLVVGHSTRGALSRMITRSVRSYCARRARAAFVAVETPALPSADASALRDMGPQRHLQQY